MPRIPHSEIERILDMTDILDVVARYHETPKRAGARYVCLCPFHDDHKPSFQVDPNRQRYHCYVCDLHGDAIDFVIRKTGCSFPEAVEMLARDRGYEIQYEHQTKEEIEAAKRRGEWRGELYDLNALAVEYYQEQLQTRSGADSLAYLRRRKISDDSIAAFAIGWSPPDGQSLYKHLRKQNVSVKAMIAAGLAREQADSAQDFFTARIMFPFRDISGRVIGFSARLLPGDTRDAGKYVNTSATTLFNKSQAIYGIDIASKYAGRDKRNIVCEGQIDVILMHQFGFKSTVALSGSASTIDGARMLKRAAPEVIILTDADAGGRKAAVRMAPLLLEIGLRGRIAGLPEGKDPADMLTDGKQDALADIIDSAKDSFEFVLDLMIAERDIRNPHDVAEIAREMMKTAAASDDPLIRQALRKRIAERLFLKEAELSFDAREIAAQTRDRERERASQLKAQTAAASEYGSFPEPFTMQAKAERDMLAALLQNPFLIDRVYEMTDLNMEALIGPGHRELGRAIETADIETERPDGQPLTLRDILRVIGDDIALRRLAERLADPPPNAPDLKPDEVTDRFDKRARRVCEMMLTGLIDQKTRDLAKARADGDRGGAEQIERQIFALSAKRQTYKDPGFNRR